MHCGFRVWLWHMSGVAACRCLILQRRRDVAAGAELRVPPRRGIRVASYVHVGVLYITAALCDTHAWLGFRREPPFARGQSVAFA
jgi:hypothetical protein